MVKSTNDVKLQNLHSQLTQFTNAAYAEADIFTAGSNDSIVRKIAITSTDSSARVFNLYAHDGTHDFLVGSLSIPANSGTDGVTVGVGFMASTVNSSMFMVDDCGNYYCYLPTGWKLRGAIAAQPTADKVITVLIQGADY